MRTIQPPFIRSFDGNIIDRLKEIEYVMPDFGKVILDDDVVYFGGLPFRSESEDGDGNIMVITKVILY